MTNDPSHSRAERLERLQSALRKSPLANTKEETEARINAHAYGTYFMGEKDRWVDRMRARFRLEQGLALGGGILFVGIVLEPFIVVDSVSHGFGRLAEERLAVLAATLIIVGIQIFFSSFLLSILRLRRRR